MDHQKRTVRHSRAVLFSLRRFELHRPSFASAKWQKIGVCLSNRRGGFPRPPVNFDVFCPSVTPSACHLPNKWGGLRNGQDRSLPCKFFPLIPPQTPICTSFFRLRRMGSAAYAAQEFAFFVKLCYNALRMITFLPARASFCAAERRIYV